MHILFKRYFAKSFNCFNTIHIVNLIHREVAHLRISYFNPCKTVIYFMTTIQSWSFVLYAKFSLDFNV